MQPVRSMVAVLFAAAILAAGCTAHTSTDQPPPTPNRPGAPRLPIYRSGPAPVDRQAPIYAAVLRQYLTSGGGHDGGDAGCLPAAAGPLDPVGQRVGPNAGDMAVHAHLDLVADPVYRSQGDQDAPVADLAAAPPGTMTASPEDVKLSGPTSARDRVIARRTALVIGSPGTP